MTDVPARQTVPRQVPRRQVSRRRVSQQHQQVAARQVSERQVAARQVSEERPDGVVAPPVWQATAPARPRPTAVRGWRGRPGPVAALVAAGAVLLSGCGSSHPAGSADYTALPGVRGVRTGDGGKALVVAYTAGACRQAAKARVAETASAVTLTAALPKSCRTGRVEWALKFRLGSVAGTRAVHDGVGGPVLTVFDGSVLTDPHHLPAGYRQQSGTQGPVVAGSWTRDWVPAKGTTGDELQVTQAPGLLPAAPGSPVGGRHLVGRLPAVVTRDPATKTLSVQWIVPGRHRAARVAAVQTAARPTLTVSALLAVAASLPVRG